MRIGILNWRDSAHPAAGGAELILHEIGRRWARSGHEVTLHSSGAPGLAPVELDGGLRIVRTGSLKNGSHHLRAPRRLKEEGPLDVVLESINTIPYLLPLRSRGLPPFLPFVHQLAVDVWSAHLPRTLAAMAARIEPRLYLPYRKTEMIVYSDSTRSDLRSLGVSVVHIVPQGGVGPQPIFDKQPDPTLVFVGRLAANKRPDHAIEAFKLVKREFPNARLWILGDGELRERIAGALPEDAEYLGKVPHASVVEWMGRAHVLLVPSIREGWGMVATEANATGTVAVAYDVPGLRDSVKDGVTGVLTAPTPHAMADGVLRLLRDHNLYERLRRNAIEWGRSFTWERMSAAVLEHLQRVAQRRPLQITGR